jgi:hypothetical protein
MNAMHLLRTKQLRYSLRLVSLLTTGINKIDIDIFVYSVFTLNCKYIGDVIDSNGFLDNVEFGSKLTTNPYIIPSPRVTSTGLYCIAVFPMPSCP